MKARQKRNKAARPVSFVVSYNGAEILRSRRKHNCRGVLIAQGYNIIALETKKNAHPFGRTLFAILKIKVVGELEIPAFELLAHAFRIKIAVPEGAQELH